MDPWTCVHEPAAKGDLATVQALFFRFYNTSNPRRRHPHYFLFEAALRGGRQGHSHVVLWAANEARARQCCIGEPLAVAFAEEGLLSFLQVPDRNPHGYYVVLPLQHMPWGRLLHAACAGCHPDVVKWVLSKSYMLGQRLPALAWLCRFPGHPAEAVETVRASLMYPLPPRPIQEWFERQEEEEEEETATTTLPFRRALVRACSGNYPTVARHLKDFLQASRRSSTNWLRRPAYCPSTDWLLRSDLLFQCCEHAPGAAWWLYLAHRTQAREWTPRLRRLLHLNLAALNLCQVVQLHDRLFLHQNEQDFLDMEDMLHLAAARGDLGTLMRTFDARLQASPTVVVANNILILSTLVSGGRLLGMTPTQTGRVFQGWWARVDYQGFYFGRWESLPRAHDPASVMQDFFGLLDGYGSRFVESAPPSWWSAHLFNKVFDLFSAMHPAVAGVRLPKNVSAVVALVAEQETLEETWSLPGRSGVMKRFLACLWPEDFVVAAQRIAHEVDKCADDYVSERNIFAFLDLDIALVYSMHLDVYCCRATRDVLQKAFPTLFGRWSELRGIWVASVVSAGVRPASGFV